MKSDVEFAVNLGDVMKKSNIILMIAVVVIIVVTGWALFQYSEETGEGDRITKVTETEMLIENKKLSDHEADYYREVNNE